MSFLLCEFVFPYTGYACFERIFPTKFGILNWMIGFIASYIFIQFVTTGSTAPSVFYTLSVHRSTRTRDFSLH
jgi:hypothetical protein